MEGGNTMLIQILLGVFITFLIASIVSVLYFFLNSFFFKKEIKLADPTKHSVIQLGQDIYIDTQDPLDQMGIYGRLFKFSKELKSSFPTGERELDRSYYKLKKAEKVMTITFMILLCYIVVFISALFICFRND